jgi:hypothetical protein
MLLHNILPLRGRLARFGMAADGLCGQCGGLEDMQHFFQWCPMMADLWDGLYFRLVGLMPGLLSDHVGISGSPSGGGERSGGSPGSLRG